MMAPGDLTGALILMGVFVAIIAGSEAWSRLGNPSAEASRKAVHLGSGLACLLFPLLVTSPWVVLVMAAAMTGFFRLTAHFGLLESVHGVERRSRGSEYYPLSIFLVFVLAGDDFAIYVSSVLVLGVADAFAALVGSKWGRLRYTVQEDKKSIEGSAAFFLIAFAAIAIPGAFGNAETMGQVLLSAGIAATLLTGFEAVSLAGSDNLFVPVAACVILQKQESDPVWMLVDQALVLVGLLVVLVALNRATGYMTERRQTAFNSGGAIVSAMFAYAVWTLGGFDWAVPVLATFAGYVVTWIVAQQFREAENRVAVRTTYRALLVPLAVLIVANTYGLYELLYGPFLAACSSVLAFGAWNRLRGSGMVGQGAERLLRALAVGLVAGLFVILPATLLQTDAPVGSAATLIALLGPITALDAHTVDWYDLDPPESLWPGPNFYLSALTTLLVLAAQYHGWLATWHPDIWNAVKM